MFLDRAFLKQIKYRHDNQFEMNLLAMPEALKA